MFRACAFEIVFFTLNNIGISNKKFHFIGTLILTVTFYKCRYILFSLDRIFIIHRLYKVLHCYTTELMATLSVKERKIASDQ